MRYINWGCVQLMTCVEDGKYIVFRKGRGDHGWTLYMTFDTEEALNSYIQSMMYWGGFTVDKRRDTDAERIEDHP